MHNPPVPRRRVAEWMAGRLGMAALTLAAGLGPSAPAAAAAEAAPAANRRAEPAEALAAAQRDFQAFVRRSLANHEGTLPDGFPFEVNDLQDLQNARLAYGFEVHTVDPQDLFDPRAELSRRAKPTGTWRFVVQLEGRPIGLATVQQHNGRWETVSFGATVLAKDVDAVMGRHANGARSNVRFIRVFQAQSDFLEVQDARDGRARFAPLFSARQSLLLQPQRAGVAADPAGLAEQADLIEPLRAAVRKNLDGFR
ncbi:hypothetical protein [Inhella sp.]|uniref:hypothetical protein n=1 Tax=Inhella sp. TaxID=1921806 RepID=UPI0035AF5FE8